jgi:hypothetical protein
MQMVVVASPAFSVAWMLSKTQSAVREFELMTDD